MEIEELLVLLSAKFTGIMTAQPIMLMKMKMLRHILLKRKKMTASSPMVSTSCASRVLITGLIQEKKPLPTGGGACFRSACLTLGAYTSE